MIEPEEVAKLAVVFASDERDATTGQAVWVCGGFKMHRPAALAASGETDSRDDTFHPRIHGGTRIERAAAPILL